MSAARSPRSPPFSKQRGIEAGQTIRKNLEQSREEDNYDSGSSFAESDITAEREEQKQQRNDPAGQTTTPPPTGNRNSNISSRNTNGGRTKSTLFQDRNKSLVVGAQRTDQNARSVTPTRSQLGSGGNNGLEMSKEEMKKFNPGIFHFKKNSDGANLQQEVFKKAFYNNNKANKDKINQQLVELTYMQVMNRLKKESKNEGTTIPAEFKQNEMKWASQLMRSKKLQKIMANYTEEIAKVLDNELRDAESKTLVQDWVQYPHKHRKSVSPPARNTIQLEELQFPVWMPEKATPMTKIKDGGVQSVYNKHRKHLDELAMKNRKKQEVLQELQAKASKEEFAQQKITEQVLNKMAVQRIRRGKALRKEKPGMTPFQEAIHEKLQQAQQRIDSIQTLDDEFGEQLKEIEEDLTESNKLKGGKNPGGQILHMLTKWSQQNVYTDDDMSKYAGELWLTAQEFEKELRETEYALDLENQHLKASYRTRIDGIRANTSMRIEALESALIETKLKLSRERERAEMQLAEMESRMYNNHLDANSEMNQRVQTVDQTLDDPQFKDISDEKKINLLQRMLRRLRLCISSLQNEKTQFKKEINELNFKVETNIKFNEQAQNSVDEAVKQNLYYQLTLYDMLQQTGILSNVGPDSPLSDEKRLALQEIVELNQERIQADEEQDRTFGEPDEKKKIARLIKFVKEFHEVLIEVDFRKIFNHYQTVVQAKARSVERITKELTKLGMLEELKEKEEYVNPIYRTGQTTGDLITVATLDQGKNDAFEQKIIRVDGAQLKSLQRQFDTLGKSMNTGMADLIKQQEKMDQRSIGSNGEILDSDTDSNSDSDNSESSQDSQSSSYVDRSSKRSSRVNSAGSTKNTFGVDIDSLAKKDRKVDGEAKNARMAKLQEKQAERQALEAKRLKQAERQKSLQKRSSTNAARKAKKINKTAENSESFFKIKDAHEGSDSEDQVQGSEGGPGLSSDPSRAQAQNVTKGATKKTRTSKREEKSEKRREPGEKRERREKREKRDKNQQKTAETTKDEQPTKVTQAKKSKNDASTATKTTKTQKKVQKRQTGLSYATGAADSKDENDDQAEGFQSDGNHTEPLDRTRDVLDELEGKVLLKYAEQIQEAEEEPGSTYKLKSQQNKNLTAVFQDSLGRKLKQSDDTKLQMTGNLPEFIDQLNDMQVQYLRVPEEPPKKKKKKKQEEEEEIEDQEIPLADCIMTEINEEGELKGFKIRPEIAKVIMSQQEDQGNVGRDMTQIIKIIRSVNFLNRIILKPDFYILGTQKGGMKSFSLPSRGSTQRGRPSTFQQNQDGTQSSQGSRPVSPNTPRSRNDNSDEFTQMMSLLKSHAAAIYAKGNEKMKKYQLNMQKNTSLEEMMQYVIPNIVEEQLPDGPDNNGNVSSRPATANLTFMQYLQILLKHIEDKLQTVIMPYQSETKAENLSVQDLVYLSMSVDDDGVTSYHASIRPSTTITNRPRGNGAPMVDQSCQTDAFLSPSVSPLGVRNVQQPTGLNSPFPSISLSTKKKEIKKKDKLTETDDSLFVDYLKEREARDTKLQLQIVNKHIEQALGEEMTKTISTLNDFVDKVQQQSELFVQAEKELNRDGSKRSNLLGSSPSGGGHSMSQYGMNPLDKLKQMRSKIDSGNEIIQEKMNQQKQMMEKEKERRQEEFQKRKKEQEAKLREVKTKELTLVQKFPRLGAAAQTVHVQSERSYSMATTAEVSKMPLLHNSTTKASTLVQQPFKQVHMDKKTSIQNSTQSKINYHQARKRSTRPGSAGRNPPGLVAKRLDFPSTNPISVNEGNFIINGSLESKDFGGYDAMVTSASHNQSNAFTRTATSVPPRVSEVRQTQNASATRNQIHNYPILKTNTYMGGQQSRRPLILASPSGYDKSDHKNFLSPKGAGFSSEFGTVSSRNTTHMTNQMRQTFNQIQMQQNLNMHLQNQQEVFSGRNPASYLSTPQSMSLQNGHTNPGTRDSHTSPDAALINSTRQHILVEPSPYAAANGQNFARKTSTTMMMMPKGDLEASSMKQNLQQVETQTTRM